MSTPTDEVSGRSNAIASFVTAVKALVRAERERDVARAERDEWRRAADRVQVARSALERAVQRARDLADEWDAEADERDDTHPKQAHTTRICAEDLRAALDGDQP